MTPIPAVASERERLADALISIATDMEPAPNRWDLLDAAVELQRAQADALDARRLREALEQLADRWRGIENSTVAPINQIYSFCEANLRSALRTSSPDPVVPRGEDGEKGK